MTLSEALAKIAELRAEGRLLRAMITQRMTREIGVEAQLAECREANAKLDETNKLLRAQLRAAAKGGST